MEKRDKIDPDFLKLYMNTDLAEKAPEGFTVKIMTRIQLETGSFKDPVRSLFERTIPVISSIIIFILVMASVFLSSNDMDKPESFFNNMSQSLNFSLPNLDLTDHFKLNLPSWFPWLLGVIVILSLFDRALLIFFHKREK